MRKIIIKGKVYRIYDSIDEMPIVNFQKYNKYLLIDSGIGADVDSIDGHITKIAKLINTDTKKAMQELQNMRQNMFMIANSISPKYLAFTALIHSIDGVKITDLSDSNLKLILNDINGVKHSWLVDFIYSFKKKVETELEIYFPSEFTADAREKEAYDKLKQRTILMLQGIAEEKDTSKEVDEIDSYLFSLYKPKSFIGSESIEVKYDKQFETSCTFISQKTNMDAKKMTVLEFYNTLSNIREQADREAKAYKRIKK